MSSNFIARHIYFQLGLLAIFALQASPAMAIEQPIDHLFTSPKERAGLDQGRQDFSKNRSETNAPVENQIGDLITLDGFVRKSNGKTTVWINQVPQHGQENPQGITIIKGRRNPPTVSMRLPSGKSVKLKAGQTFDAVNGKVNDVYGDVYDKAAVPATKETAK